MDGSKKLVTHSVMTASELAEWSNGAHSPDHVRTWVEGTIDGQHVRFSVECSEGFEYRAQKYLERVAAKNHIPVDVHKEDVFTAGGRWGK